MKSNEPCTVGPRTQANRNIVIFLCEVNDLGPDRSGGSPTRRGHKSGRSHDVPRHNWRSSRVGELAVRGQDLPEAHEGPDHLDARLDGLGRVQDGRGHDRAMLREGDLDLFHGQLKREILREPADIPLASRRVLEIELRKLDKGIASFTNALAAGRQASNRRSSYHGQDGHAAQYHRLRRHAAEAAAAAAVVLPCEQGGPCTALRAASARMKTAHD